MNKELVRQLLNRTALSLNGFDYAGGLYRNPESTQRVDITEASKQYWQALCNLDEGTEEGKQAKADAIQLIKDAWEQGPGSKPHRTLCGLRLETTNNYIRVQSNWMRFFDVHAKAYMDNVFTRATVAEVDFLVEHLGLRPGMRVLDMGCGTGRHSIEMARRGLDVTGVDLSDAMLREARQAAETAGVRPRFVQCDATAYRADQRYDRAICLCEGAFCLLGQSDDPVGRDLGILRNIAEALVPGGRFMLTTLNAARMFRAHDKPDFQGTFDLRTLVQTYDMEEGTGDQRVRVCVRERHYVATELELMCRTVGLTVDHIGGGTAGNWGLRPIDPDEIELMVLAHKREG
jgi:cyclopropane fatty-acyl-phospholipid synthase-like methyltransferase